MPFYVVNAQTGQALAAYNTLPEAVSICRNAMPRIPTNLIIADNGGRVIKIFSHQPFPGSAFNPQGRFFENFTDNLIAARRLGKALQHKKIKPKEYKYVY